MKHFKWLPLLLAGAMTLSVVSFAGCDSGDDKKDNETNQGQQGTEGGGTEGGSGNQGGTEGGGTEGGGTEGGGTEGGGTEGGNQGASGPAVSGVICYDNLPDDGITLSAQDTTFAGPKGLDPSKFTVSVGSDYTKVATYDATTGVFTAVGAGEIVYTDASGALGRLTVAPAYVEDPQNQYTTIGNDTSETRSTFLGHTHDPSFVEVVSGKGKSTYYLFSTGWADQSNVDGSKTYGNAIHSSTDLVNWTFEGRTFDVETRDEDFVDTKAGKWLYDGITTGYDSDDASWWAPDIVPCPTGGYWLYTCVVDGAGDSQGMQLAGGNYARACILLYWSRSVLPGTFKPVTYPDGENKGDPVVLMQSSIRRGESEKDVNGIDPQIIYSPDGKMYMAYGSFGSGDYMIELDPNTGMRKDGKGWQTHETIRGYINSNSENNKNPEIVDPENIQELFNKTPEKVGWEHPYYGKNISRENMEAPVIARHDDVKIFDETAQFDDNGEPVGVEGKTYYYTMHSYDGLGDNYQMWGGRSEDVWGIYRSVGGGIVHNVGPGSSNSGNKYMGAFKWSYKAEGVKEYDIILPGHNDLYTTKDGVDLAAYITRIPDPNSATNTGNFVTQIHQYYLNSLGHIVINPNRYGREVDRSVSEEELFAYTQNDTKGYKFQMVVMANQRDTAGGDFRNIQNVSRDVYLTADHKITEANGAELGTWQMYGRGYIKFSFNSTLKGSNNRDSGNKVFYGVVRPAWLGDQNKSGFTITTLGGDEKSTRSMAMFMNNYSTLTGEGLGG